MAETIHYAPVDPNSPSSTERTWAAVCHGCGGLVWLVFVGLIASLVIWLVKKNESAFINQQGREALNFRLTMLIAYILCVPLIFLCGIGIFLMAIIPLVEIIFAIIAAIRVSEGRPYRYPVCVRLL